MLQIDMSAREDLTPYTAATPVRTVISDPVFDGCGPLIFPEAHEYAGGDTLGTLHMTWYDRYLHTANTLDVLNDMRRRAEDGETVFLPLYTKEEVRLDPAKAETGLFVFPGASGRRFALVVPGGAWAYVASMQDSFPVALDISRHGFSAFALVYRLEPQAACEDAARAVQLIFQHAQDFQVNTTCYSVWGASAAGMIAAWIGTYGPASFGAPGIPKPGAVIMQYSNHPEVTGQESPTFAVIGSADEFGYTMQNYTEALARRNIRSRFASYPGVAHGFGLGDGTAAAGWVDQALEFWKEQMPAG